MIRIYVERKAGFDNEARRIYADISGFLGIDGVTSVRYLNRYDVENVSDDVAKAASTRIFSASRCCRTESTMPRLNSALFSNRELDQAGPWPALLVV